MGSVKGAVALLLAAFVVGCGGSSDPLPSAPAPAAGAAGQGSDSADKNPPKKGAPTATATGDLKPL